MTWIRGALPKSSDNKPPVCTKWGCRRHASRIPAASRLTSPTPPQKNPGMFRGVDSRHSAHHCPETIQMAPTSALATAAASPADTRVLPTPVFAPHTTRVGNPRGMRRPSPGPVLSHRACRRARNQVPLALRAPRMGPGASAEPALAWAPPGTGGFKGNWALPKPSAHTRLVMSIFSAQTLLFVLYDGGISLGTSCRRACHGMPRSANHAIKLASPSEQGSRPGSQPKMPLTLAGEVPGSAPITFQPCGLLLCASK